MKFSPTSKAWVGYIARPRASDTDPEMAPFVCGPCLLLVFSLYALVVQESLIRFWGHDLWVDFPFLHQLKSEKKKKTHISITLCVFLFAFINLISIDEVDFCNILKGKKTYREVIHLQVFFPDKAFLSISWNTRCTLNRYRFPNPILRTRLVTYIVISVRISHPVWAFSVSMSILVERFSFCLFSKSCEVAKSRGISCRLTRNMNVSIS